MATRKVFLFLFFDVMDDPQDFSSVAEMCEMHALVDIISNSDKMNAGFVFRCCDRSPPNVLRRLLPLILDFRYLGQPFCHFTLITTMILPSFRDVIRAFGPDARNASGYTLLQSALISMRPNNCYIAGYIAGVVVGDLVARVEEICKLGAEPYRPDADGVLPLEYAQKFLGLPIQSILEEHQLRSPAIRLLVDLQHSAGLITYRAPTDVLLLVLSYHAGCALQMWQVIKYKDHLKGVAEAARAARETNIAVSQRAALDMAWGDLMDQEQIQSYYETACRPLKHPRIEATDEEMYFYDDEYTLDDDGDSSTDSHDTQ